MRKTLLWLALCATVTSLPAHAAEQRQSELSESQSSLSTYADSSVDQAMENLSEEEKQLARKWMLTEKDWVKYKQIMSGPRGIWSPDLDPITALGVMETDPAERRRYAEIWMKMEARRAELELAFEVERMAASQRVLGNMPVVKNQQWINEWEAKQNQRTHDVMLFVDTSCLENCGRLFEEVLESTGAGDDTRLNVYFPAGTSAEEIGEWAQTIGVDPEIVKSRKVTLNFDRGEYSRYDIARADLPEVRVVNLKTGDVRATFKRW